MDFALLVDLVTLGAVGLVVLLATRYLPSYMKQKGKNLATKEDVSAITRQMESVKHDYAATLEELKAALRGGDVLFEKKLEATLELNKLIAAISPHMHHPDMDWSEACDHIAHEFPRLERDLGLYLAHHDVVLSTHVRDILQECRAISGQRKFEVHHGDIPSDTNTAAGDVFNKLKQCADGMRDEINTYVSGRTRVVN